MSFHDCDGCVLCEVDGIPISEASWLNPLLCQPWMPTGHVLRVSDTTTWGTDTAPRPIERPGEVGRGALVGTDRHTHAKHAKAI